MGIFFDNVTSTRGTRDGGSKLATLRSLRDLRFDPPSRAHLVYITSCSGYGCTLGPVCLRQQNRGKKLASARWSRFACGSKIVGRSSRVHVGAGLPAAAKPWEEARECTLGPVCLRQQNRGKKLASARWGRFACGRQTGPN